MTLIDLQGHFKCYERSHCLYIKNTPYTRNVGSQLQRSDVDSYFYTVVFDLDAERDLLGVAKFLVLTLLKTT